MQLNWIIKGEKMFQEAYSRFKRLEMTELICGMKQLLIDIYQTCGHLFGNLSPH